MIKDSNTTNASVWCRPIIAPRLVVVRYCEIIDFNGAFICYDILRNALVLHL